ncbi:nicotinate-nucleotide--dimethylbenzimidazole phosphoribosyltransferase [Ferrimicrobium sp.]|uniref:nicotinate-nucleotide--dimethylbenzimidazole phosphoribosyltransferase n=1 Tax=Ferrimicrobium sp. TaxID=2926050 RepID=UPI00260BFB92|nr:nicotinate-nucleotide--dimethylbenzimidazole phosphoribosyltransferase [Ferrimicrobium sp.]
MNVSREESSRSLDRSAMEAAKQLHGRLTKPAGSLGRLEDLGVQLAGISRACPPRVPRQPMVAIAAGDHGVLAEGVSPWPQEVTAQMIQNFLAGGAAINVLADEVGAQVVVVDCGVAATFPASPMLHTVKRARMTGNIHVEPAMPEAVAVALIEEGRQFALDQASRGIDLFLTGDMGIGNTTPSAALIATVCGVSAVQVTGRGTGVDDHTFAKKTAIVAQVVESYHGDRSNAPQLLARMGGFEHAFLAGLILGASEERVPVILDGVIAIAAALLAVLEAPTAVGYLIAGHRSVEPGASVGLAHLGLEPLLDLQLRLGEGTGAVLAVPMVRSSARILAEMATFDAAGVTEKG